MKFSLCKYFILFIVVFIINSVQGNSQHATINFASELERLINLQKLPQYINESVVKQVSSYDTTGGNDDGFSGKYSYIRKEKNGELVIFDGKGAGVIERIWTPTPTDDMLDFYFDGATSPSYSIKFSDLFSGNTYPFLTPVAGHKVGGFYSYVPIPYKQGCKIVYRGDKIMFHQIQYRELGSEYNVETMDFMKAKNNGTLLQAVVKAWSDQNRTITNFYENGYKTIAVAYTLQPGETKTIAGINKGGRIVGIELLPAFIFENDDKQIDIKITWDQESLPAVYLPVADFFGYAFGKRSMESFLMGATNGKAYCYIPMPFDKQATISLVYRNNTNKKLQPIAIHSSVYYSDEKRNPNTEGKFYVNWNNDIPAPGKPHVFLEGKGRGHYVGTLLQAQATTYTYFTEFFEGDDRTDIDGKMTIHGTGSEDYFNGGWYAQPGGWVERLGAPLSGCLDYTLPLSRTGGYRFYMTDKMPFNKNILHTIEHGPEKNNRPVNYISVAMYYADKSITASRKPENAATKVFTPDTITFYTRLMRHLTYNGNLLFKNDAAVLLGNDNASLTINVTEVPKGKYKIYLHQIKAAVNTTDVKIADASRVQDWQTIKINKGEAQEDLLLGETEVTDNAIPINILFRNKVTNPDIIFDRVMLVKL